MNISNAAKIDVGLNKSWIAVRRGVQYTCKCVRIYMEISWYCMQLGACIWFGLWWREMIYGEGATAIARKSRPSEYRFIHLAIKDVFAIDRLTLISAARLLFNSVVSCSVFFHFIFPLWFISSVSSLSNWNK